MIDAPNVGWALQEGAAKADPDGVSNATLFDFKGQAMPVLDI